MATIQGTRFTYSDTANNAIDMSSGLAMISPSDVPLLSLIGRDSLSKPATAVKHEWLEDILRPLDTAIATQGEFSGAGAVTTSTVTAGTGVYLVAGDVIKIDSELMLINSISTDTLNILAGGRGYGGSTAAAHTTLTPIRIMAPVNVQGAAVTTPRTTTKSGLFNYTQIYQDAFTITSTQRSTDKWVGPNDETAAQLDRLNRIAWILFERTLLDGRKVAPAAGVAGAMDGILPRITTNAYAKAGAYMTEDFLLQALSDSWTAGGNPDTVILGAFQKRQINKFLDSQRMTSRTDTTAGVVIDRYTSDFGNVDIVLDRNMPTDTVLIIQKDKIGFGPLVGNALHAAPLPQTTLLQETWQVVGEYTSETRNENAHAKITGLATS